MALDTYFQAFERVDLIKMDIQGFELHALEGAKRVFADNPQLKLLIELWPYGLRAAGTDWRDVISFLETRQKSVLHISHGKLLPFRPQNTREERDWFVNLLVVPA